MLGELTTTDGRFRLRFRRALGHPAEKVWRALTEDEHLRAWFPADIVGERAEGAALRFVFRDEDGNELPPLDGMEVVGEVVRCQPPAVFEFTWGAESLRFELEPAGDGCVLTFLNTFDELGKAARDAAGWHVCLDELELHLAGERSPLPTEQRWREVHPRYVELLGPEAATIGPPEGHG